MSGAKIGDAPRRREDDRFLTGRACYLDDADTAGVAHAVVLRSPHAHASIRAIDMTEASALPGVIAVLTAQDVARDGLQPVRPTAEANAKTGEPFAFIPQPLLADGKVRYVGEPVAFVVAATRDAALDAAEAVVVDYAPLPAITTPAEARAPDAPRIAPNVPGNVVFDWRTGATDDVARAIENAAHVVRLSIDNHRVLTNALETRCGIARYDAATERITVHIGAQNVHVTRDNIARALNLAPDRVRLLATDVGGGFGTKNFTYPEYILLAWAAKKTGRPVKWMATRSEAFLTDHAARDHQASATLALDADGRFLALDVDSVTNAGAYLMSTGAVQTYQYIHLPGSVYRLPSIALRIAAVLTNTTPLGVTRGPGFAEAVHIIERLIDAAAHQCGFDRIDLRRRNMMPSAEMPMTNAFGQKINSGAFPETFDLALARADTAGFAARRAASERAGRLRGLGVVYHIKGTGGFPSENTDVRFEDDGSISLIVGTQTIGQGHETTFPQILADRLGIDDKLIRLRQADTDLIPMGGGSASSRSTYMVGTVIWRAADDIIAKARAFAAEMLEAAETDLRFEDGRFVVAGTDRAVLLVDVARQARAAGAPLQSYQKWTREWLTYPNGAHIVEVEIDPETGVATLARYTAVDDYGVLVNPMVVTGQVHGSIAQGVGQALLERVAYHQGSGQPLSASFMDYAMPRADDLPTLDLTFSATRCTTNPLGVKGVGESGAIAALPAIANAVDDALIHAGAAPLTLAPTPERIWMALHARSPSEITA